MRKPDNLRKQAADNYRNVELATEALQPYELIFEDDEKDLRVRSLLADLRHYCDKHEICFADNDRFAHMNYLKERLPE